jgi:hypothetical protein
MHDLIDDIFLEAFDNESQSLEDQAARPGILLHSGDRLAHD